MLIHFIAVGLAALALYLALGLVFALVFVSLGVQRIDTSAVNASFGFRMIILPGTIALWPIMLVKWLKAARSAEGQEP